MNKIDIAKRATAAGIIIGLCAMMYSSIENKYYGAALFSFGLAAIVVNKSKLYTGVAGFIKSKKAILEAVWILLFNLIATFVLGILCKYCGYQTTSEAIWTSKINQPILLFILKSVLCGAVIHIGVKSYRNNSIIPLLLCVVLFVICGLEHCIANSFYMFYSMNFSILSIAYLLINILGNTIGALAIENVMPEVK